MTYKKQAKQKNIESIFNFIIWYLAKYGSTSYITIAFSLASRHPGLEIKYCTLLPIQEMWIRTLGWIDPLEKEMAAHSSTLARKIPWTEDPGGLQSLGSQKSWIWLNN